MAHLHFVTNHGRGGAARAQWASRPSASSSPGSPGIDGLLAVEPATRAEFEVQTGLRLAERNILVTFHPVTVAPGRTDAELSELIAALAGLPQDIGVIVTRANADAEGRAVNARLEAFVAERAGAQIVTLPRPAELRAGPRSRGRGGREFLERTSTRRPRSASRPWTWEIARRGGLRAGFGLPRAARTERHRAGDRGRDGAAARTG